MVMSLIISDQETSNQKDHWPGVGKLPLPAQTALFNYWFNARLIITITVTLIYSFSEKTLTVRWHCRAWDFYRAIVPGQEAYMEDSVIQYAGKCRLFFEFFFFN